MRQSHLKPTFTRSSSLKQPQKASFYKRNKITKITLILRKEKSAKHAPYPQ